MQRSSPLLTPEEFLLNSMGSETEAGFSEFINLWQSSESLRLLIKRAVLSDPSATNALVLESKGKARSLAKSSFQKTEAARILINKGHITPTAVSEKLTTSHGGLSRIGVLDLLEKYKAGKRSLGVYLLARAWKSTGGRCDLADTRLRRLTLDSLCRAINENKADFFLEMADTLKFLQKEEYKENGRWTHDPGQWWQFHLLLFTLENPKPKYPMREFIRFFEEEVGTNEMPTSKTIRAFCRSHGIALDSTPGAPKKSKPSSKRPK